MSNAAQAVYTFHVDDPEQVDDLCELWQESLVDWDRSRGIVRVQSDSISINQFLMFYELYVYLETGGTADAVSSVSEDRGDARKRVG